MAFVKSGWLLRQSTILKRWKRNWFDLWSDGHLVYYGDQTRQSMEDKVHLPVDCINLRVGLQCRDVQPPDGRPRDCMLQVVCRDGRTVSLCAESPDDCLAWQFTLQDCRTNTAYVGSEAVYDGPAVGAPPPPPPPYTAYPAPDPEAYGYCPYGAAYAPPGAQVVYAADGQAYAVPCQYPYAGLCGPQPTRHIIVRERHPGGDGDLALGMLAGAATGMALGSLFWVF
ncbi:pleckstrin homology domain-containing family B member 2 [Phyllostomus discolor]|uniref:Pleckstrin homology domain-containing family B member 2 n=1 Tax=Phyllostomus discolor TaxID=89673 RepID=A0A6J2MR17_9CHIR|nr:pleckstrin homology domain-containing family B member 2 [Phyllostomus discolor]XP_035867041.1 pleckstrin homology domain-containing family B member 2 [Phyllostomus discolor]